MITEEKLAELRQRILKHGVINDVAIVMLTAQELQELLEEIDRLQVANTGGGK